MALVLLAFANTGDLFADSGRRGTNNTSASLNISVVVMPVVQAARSVASVPSNGAITYEFEKSPQEQGGQHIYELRPLPPNMAGDRGEKLSAVLKTLTIVPE